MTTATPSWRKTAFKGSLDTISKELKKYFTERRVIPDGYLKVLREMIEFAKDGTAHTHAKTGLQNVEKKLEEAEAHNLVYNNDPEDPEEVQIEESQNIEKSNRDGQARPRNFVGDPNELVDSQPEEEFVINDGVTERDMLIYLIEDRKCLKRKLQNVATSNKMLKTEVIGLSMQIEKQSAPKEVIPQLFNPRLTKGIVEKDFPEIKYWRECEDRIAWIRRLNGQKKTPQIDD
eukprot:TRINITY_DN209_c0_g1_i4.p1 TRINITY_DN209_c0_g1~~TRINITY_DN209_c0_g1_i4.p1  ORF type:complete len:242 (+),score=58.81 TRINITY_DN209_c0_g1_i4:31-726(+)